MDTSPSSIPVPDRTAVPPASNDPGLKVRFVALAGALANVARRAAGHVDGLSLDLARDAGAVARSGEAFYDAARDGWRGIEARTAEVWDQVRASGKGAPRVARVVKAGLALLAVARWHRLRAVAAGLDALPDEAHRALAGRVRELCVELRGGVLKLGQIASSRPDLVGAVWASELSSLQDRVPAIDAAAIVARIEDELGQPILDAFASFDPEPVAAASLAQVHRAVLADGRVVAVKVQIPGIDEVIAADIAALRMLAGVLGDAVPLDLATIADELERALIEELDYLSEADAATAFAADLTGKTLFVPAVVPERTTRRVLTTTFVDGARLTDALDAAAPAERARIVTALCDDLARQVFRSGRIHADPHPGNFLVTPDGRIAVLDFGCTLTLTAHERHKYARLLAALATRDRATMLDALAALGFGGEPDALAAMAAVITDAMRPGVSADAIDWELQGRAMAVELARQARNAGVTIPRSFVLLGRVLGTMAGLVAAYKPPIQLHLIIAPHVGAALMT